MHREEPRSRPDTTTTDVPSLDTTTLDTTPDDTTLDPALDDPTPGEPIRAPITEPRGSGPISGIQPDEDASFREPPGPPTAFGATSVGGAVAASALAGPAPTEWEDPRDEDTVAEGDGAVDERGTAWDLPGPGR